MNWKKEIHSFLFRKTSIDRNIILDDNLSIKFKSSLKKDQHIILKPFKIPSIEKFYEYEIEILSDNDDKIISDFISFLETDDINNKLNAIYESLVISIERYFNNQIKNKEDIYASTKNLSSTNIQLKPIKTELKKITKTLILICRLKNDKFLDVRRNIESNNLSNFLDDFRSFSRSIFAYWIGNKISIPNSLKKIPYSNEKINTENIKKNLYYYLFKIELEEELINSIINKNSREREKGLKQLSQRNLKYEYSGLIEELPDECIMI